MALYRHTGTGNLSLGRGLSVSPAGTKHGQRPADIVDIPDDVAALKGVAGLIAAKVLVPFTPGTKEEAKKGGETPKKEEPKLEEPKVATAKVVEPKVEEPKVEEPKHGKHGKHDDAKK